ncbi:aminotransferase class I/II-fold pyridoxal phosphate-dependent enzyme [Flavobacterium sp.]|uniref:aminotransferase class I/II-fold pyridoxal phosphate-dependent enzyme n=1 Tax=Flavobacterium sp. TaxID=239 RepID=UPI00404844DE
MVKDLFERIQNNKGPLGKWASQAEGYFVFPKLEGELGPRMQFQGKNILNWSLNDYLGLANHPEVRKADTEAAMQYGAAYPMGARMMSGHTNYHEQLENELAAFVMKESAYLLNFGYQGIMSTIDALVTRNDVIVYDVDAHACIIDGDLSQAQRDGVMKSFRGRQIQMLVATDVAARGIDVDNITHVVNYQLPDEIETYNHRSGRTGRAGKLGTSIVIITKSELRKISSIERIIQQKFQEKTIPSGIEICEIQLLHLATKIKDTEVDHEIDNYLPAINEVLDGLSKEELIKKMVSVEFNRFINYYKSKRDLSGERGNDRERSSEPREIRAGDPVRYFINIGARDDFDWMQLKDFIKETLDLGRDDVFKVDVKEGFSFFNTDGEHTEKVMSVLNGYDMNGRRINVEISKNDGGGRRDHNGRSSGGGFGGGRREGGFNRERSGSGPRREGGRDSGGFRGERSGSAPRREGGRDSGGFRGERSSSAPRRESSTGSSDRAPRRAESAGDSSRPRRPRRS